MDRVFHTIPPVYTSESEMLILGSFPSVKSREYAFFYQHPQNRFWRVLASVYNCEPLTGIAAQRSFLLENRIALWDVIASCDIVGSSDASICGVVPNDISLILSSAHIKKIFTNGGTAYRLYNKYCFTHTLTSAMALPSTSPANARCSLPSLIDVWSVIRT